MPTPNDPPPRRASLVLVTRDRTVLGRLPHVPVGIRWWPDVASVVEAAREAFGLEVVILRLLDSELPRPHGGDVTLLAEVEAPLTPRAATALEPFEGALEEQPFRMSWAVPGGPAADVAWARGVLRERGIATRGRPEQIRSWNLSSIWRLPVAPAEDAGPDDDPAAWLKVVPPFFAHEGDMLRRLPGRPVPRLLGHRGPRLLLADVPGSDRYDADLPELLTMVDALVALQAEWIGRTDELLAIGLPDWRPAELTAAIARTLELRASDLDAPTVDSLRRFVRGLGDRFAALGRLGVPDTLVHGDFHPGNVRSIEGDLSSLVILDWGDCGVGHPLLDVPAFLEPLRPEDADRIRAKWIEAWRRALPGSDPGGALALLTPIAAARQAVIYQKFLDHIEPVERRHHDRDTVEWLERTAALLASEGERTWPA